MNINLLRSQMALHGKTQTDLAVACGVRKGTISKKMHGKSEFTQGNISAIAKLLHLSREMVCAIFFDDVVSQRKRKERA